MPFNVHCFCAYLLNSEYPKSGRHYEANAFVSALKNDPIIGYHWVPIRGTAFKLIEENKEEAFELFGQMAADYLLTLFGDAPLDLIAIPNSKAVPKTTEKPRTARMIEAIVASGGTSIQAHDILRWKKPLQSARSEGGRRDPRFLYSNLVLIGRVPKQGVVILVDDTMHHSGHMRACAAFLEKHGAPPALALCAGRTVETAVADAFQPIDEAVDDFDPDDYDL